MRFAVKCVGLGIVIAIGLLGVNWIIALNKAVHAALGIPVFVITLVLMPTSVMTMATADSESSFESNLVYVIAILANGAIYLLVGMIWRAFRKRKASSMAA